MYQLSILLPSAWPEKRTRFIENLQETLSNFKSVEVVICLDGDKETWRDGNVVYTYSSPSKYRSTFFDAAFRASTGRFLLLANDDILFKTKNWDLMIPYDQYPDDLVLYHFRDNMFNKNFACHPVFSRRVMEFDNNLLEPLHQITKCDNTIWDIHPASRRIYLPDIEIEHQWTPYGPEWNEAYTQDNKEYDENEPQRNRTREWILEQLGVNNNKVLIGVVTGEYARRADFYDYFNMLDKPPGAYVLFCHDRSPAHGRNLIIEEALKYDCTHVLFIDDDMAFKPSALKQLLEHKKDVITGLYLKRAAPFDPFIFDEVDERGAAKHAHLNGEESKLKKVANAALGFCLVKTSVFRSMDKPWIRLGELDPQEWCDDIGFFNRVTKAGFEIYCDLECCVGHIGTFVVWPQRDEHGKWFAGMDTSGKVDFSIPLQIEKKQ